jgi:hypothetical protein
MPEPRTKTDAAPVAVDDDEPDDWWGTSFLRLLEWLTLLSGQGQEDLQHRMFRYVF